ncbi:MAG: type II toxin-antitoxin system VapC family toxin [Terriglobales bacterium]
MKADATRSVVLDASVPLAWCFEDESDALPERVLDVLETGTEMLTPSIWPLEVANALLMAERRERITNAQATAFLQRISKLPILVEPISPSRAFEHILQVARQYQLTEYDAAYVELALREALPLATLDAKMRRAARLAGLTLVE